MARSSRRAAIFDDESFAFSWWNGYLLTKHVWMSNACTEWLGRQGWERQHYISLDIWQSFWVRGISHLENTCLCFTSIMIKWLNVLYDFFVIGGSAKRVTTGRITSSQQLSSRLLHHKMKEDSISSEATHHRHLIIGGQNVPPPLLTVRLRLNSKISKMCIQRSFKRNDRI